MGELPPVPHPDDAIRHAGLDVTIYSSNGMRAGGHSPARARSNHDASLLVIEALFGWVSNSADLIAALERSDVAVQAPVL